jgi:hypothetical protein
MGSEALGCRSQAHCGVRLGAVIRIGMLSRTSSSLLWVGYSALSEHCIGFPESPQRLRSQAIMYFVMRVGGA